MRDEYIASIRQQEDQFFNYLDSNPDMDNAEEICIVVINSLNETIYMYIDSIRSLYSEHMLQVAKAMSNKEKMNMHLELDERSSGILDVFTAHSNAIRNIRQRVISYKPAPVEKTKPKSWLKLRQSA